MTSTTTPAPSTTRTPLDIRGYWRVLLAVVAPLGFLTVGIANFLTPYELGGSTSARIADIEAHQELMGLIVPAYIAFLVFFAPSAIALILALRRVKPVFTAVMGTWMAFAALAGAANPPIDFVILTGVKENLDPAALAALADGLEGSVVTGFALLPMILLLTFGRIALGVLFWKANVGPRWLAALMMVSPFIEFAPLGIGNAQPGMSWVASAIAMTYISIVLLRMRNDDFDLPAITKKVPSESPRSRCRTREQPIRSPRVHENRTG